MIKELSGVARQFLGDNASTILTASGVVGTIATAVLASRASVKAIEVLHEKEKIYEEQYPDDQPSKLDNTLLVAPFFIPPVLVGGLTITAIIMAHRVNATKIAALTAAYATYQGRLEELQKKLSERLTGPKKTQIDDEIAQDHVTKTPNTEVIIIGEGDVLCFDMLSGRYFRGNVERIRRAEHTLNEKIVDDQFASLSDFYDEIGLAATELSDSLGWSTLVQDPPVKVKLSTTLTPEEKPCIAVDFNILPVPDYQRNY